jgi:hypothetical protein
VSEGSFRELLSKFPQYIPPEKVEAYLQIIDPFNNQKITFSECVHLLSQETCKRDNVECAVLELIATPPDKGARQARI